VVADGTEGISARLSVCVMDARSQGRQYDTVALVRTAGSTTSGGSRFLSDGADFVDGSLSTKYLAVCACQSSTDQCWYDRVNLLVGAPSESDGVMRSSIRVWLMILVVVKRGTRYMDGT
jgi:hypothetical protein